MKKFICKFNDYIIGIGFIVIFVYSMFIEKYVSDSINKNILNIISVVLIFIFLSVIFKDFKDKSYKTRLPIILIDMVSFTLMSILILISIYKNINDYLGTCLLAIILLNVLVFLRKSLQNNKFLKDKYIC